MIFMNRLMIFFYILNLLNAEADFLIQEFNSRYKKNFIKKSSILYSKNINIINLYPDGFIIISNHENYSKILGFSFKNSFSTNDLPENLKYLLYRYQSEINFISLERNFNYYIYDFDRSVDQLISAQWDQGYPFNEMCPFNTMYGNSVVGCVAVGMAQVMHY